MHEKRDYLNGLVLYLCIEEEREKNGMFVRERQLLIVYLLRARTIPSTTQNKFYRKWDCALWFRYVRVCLTLFWRPHYHHGSCEACFGRVFGIYVNHRFLRSFRSVEEVAQGAHTYEAHEIKSNHHRSVCSILPSSTFCDFIRIRRVNIPDDRHQRIQSFSYLPDARRTNERKKTAINSVCYLLLFPFFFILLDCVRCHVNRLKGKEASEKKKLK